MGSVLQGLLIYGYRLGGADEDWEISGLDRWSPWVPSWATDEMRDEIDGGKFDYCTAIEKRLAAEQVQGVEVDTCGMVNYSDLFLAAWKTSATGSASVSVPVDELDTLRRNGGWDGRLAVALRALDITPQQPHPMFLLTQSYG